MKKIYLTKNKDSWVTIEMLPEELMNFNYKELFKHKPKDLSEVILFNKKSKEHSMLKVGRRYLCYMNSPDFDKDVKKSYMFYSDNKNKDLPEAFMPFYNFVKGRDSRFNQAVINWYNNGEEYIAMHSDCTAKMIDDPQIQVVNLNEGKQKRIFTFTPKEGVDAEEVKLELEHGAVLTMGGRNQEMFKHGVLPDDSITEGRISISFRQMRSNVAGEKFNKRSV